jgi:transposase
MYSNDLKKAAMTAYSIMSSHRKVGLCFGVAHSTIWRWVRTSVPAEKNYYKPNGEWIRSKIVITFIQQVIQDSPFITRLELRRKIDRVFQFTPSLKLVSVAIKHAGLSKVKCRTKCVGKFPPKQEDFERFSNLFREENVVAIDECGFQTQHVPLKGYTKKGNRLYFKCTTTSRKWLTSTVAICPKLGNYSVFCKNSQTGDGFASFISSLPFPQGTKIVMDNASIHKTLKVRSALEQKQYIPVYIPPYSPDFNPIENIFGVVKSSWRRRNANSFQDWSKASSIIKDIFDLKATAESIIRQFRHTSNLLTELGKNFVTQKTLKANTCV